MVIIISPGKLKSSSLPAAAISFQRSMVATNWASGTSMSFASSSSVSALRAFSLMAAAVHTSFGP